MLINSRGLSAAESNDAVSQSIFLNQIIRSRARNCWLSFKCLWNPQMWFLTIWYQPLIFTNLEFMVVTIEVNECLFVVEHYLLAENTAEELQMKFFFIFSLSWLFYISTMYLLYAIMHTVFVILCYSYNRSSHIRYLLLSSPLSPAVVQWGSARVHRKIPIFHWTYDRNGRQVLKQTICRLNYSIIMIAFFWKSSCKWYYF